MKEICPFCTGKVQHSAFAMEAGFMAVLNHSPVLPGHLLIIPLKHTDTLFSLSEEEIGRFFNFARTITRFITREHDAQAFDWSLQEGEEAGQSVSHLHLHIIPRRINDLEGEEDWYVKLQAGKALDDAQRPIMDSSQYEYLTGILKKKWADYQGKS
ncbi:MAG: HIT domain-containing protein [Lentimicrobiaceae bacterium]|nr:HIT domain-containing protein [Lentimicrobiaceae bacterium]